MTRTLSALVLALAAAGGLAAATAQDLVGSWVVDQDATWESWKDRPEMQQVPEQMRDTVKTMALQAMGRMSWEITPTEMVRDDGKKKETLAYQVVSTEGDALTVESSESGGAPRKGRVVVDGGRLQISGFDDAAKGEPESAGVLVLKRKDAAAAPAEQPKKQ